MDTLRYMWQKLHAQVSELQTTLLEIQTEFRDNLVKNVEVYSKAVTSFVDDYTTNGPMVVGIPPREASDCLVIFQVSTIVLVNL